MTLACEIGLTRNSQIVYIIRVSQVLLPTFAAVSLVGGFPPVTTKPNSVAVFHLAQYTSLSLGEKLYERRDRRWGRPRHPGIPSVVGSATTLVCSPVQSLPLQSS